MNEIVLDTNVLISGILSPHNAPGRIVDAIQGGRISIVADDRILSEYRLVMRRPRFAKYLNDNDREAILEFLETTARRVSSSTVFQDLPDPKDACFLEVAAEAAVPLVSGNSKHYPEDKRRGVTVYTPTNFVSSHLAM